MLDNTVSKMSPLPVTSDAQPAAATSSSPPPPSLGSSTAVDRQSAMAPQSPTSSNRQRFNQRLQKYHLNARFDFKCDGPQHAQRWKCFCYVGTIFVGCSSWRTSTDAAKEEATGHGVKWFDQFGYP
jgi:hypothetical protein